MKSLPETKHESRGLEWAREQQELRQARLRVDFQNLLQNQKEAAATLLEIGCGHGHWLSAYAKAHPQTACVGIDLKSKRVELARRKVEKSGLRNLEFYKAEAGEFLQAAPNPFHWDQVCMLFLDPWPKVRHHKNRLIQNDFLYLLAEKMNPNGKLYFRTDHRAYYKWTFEHLNAHPQWMLCEESPWIYEHPSYFQEFMQQWCSLVARPKPPTR